jgi:hypothetical protein
MDGTHFSDIGYILFADEFIRAINNSYGTHIPFVSVSKAFQNNDPATAKAIGISMTPEVAAQMISVFNSAPASAPPPPARKHSVH